MLCGLLLTLIKKTKILPVAGIAAAAFSLVFSGHTLASSVVTIHDVDFTSGGDTATKIGDSRYLFEVPGLPGVTLRVTGYSTENSSTTHTNSNTAGFSLGRWNYGIGLQNSNGDNSHTVDGSGWDDTIRLTFFDADDVKLDVHLLNVEFGYYADHYIYDFAGKTWYHSPPTVTAIDDTVLIDALGDGTPGNSFTLPNPVGGFGNVTVNPVLEGNRFDLTAVGTHDSWKVAGITFSHTAEMPPVTAAPSPAAVGIGMIGLLSLGLKRRRYRHH